MTHSRRSLGPVVALLLLGAPAAAQGRTVTGVVTDSSDGQPVPGVRVALGTWLGAYSDRAGRFTIPVPAGRFTPRVSCPRSGQAELTRTLPELVVGGPTDGGQGPTLEIVLPAGRECLPALEAVGYLEAAGILRGGETRRLQLCESPSHGVALALPDRAARDLARRFGGRDDPKRPVLALTVRGQLEGPGFFGHDGSAAYLLTVETIRSARRTAEADACR